MVEKNQEELDFFIMLFWDELDSWFGTDFLLCDCCIDEFKSKWVGIDLMDEPLSGIQLDYFCSGSR